MRIELCGGLASGKTSLASSIKEITPNYNVVFEDFSATGHLADFYNNPKYYAFETEIFCLLSHVHSIKVSMLDNKPILCDFSLVQDWVYSKINLNNTEWRVYEQVYQEAVRQVNQTDLVVFLTCSVDEMLKRIRIRGRKSEESVDENYQNQIVNGLRKRLLETKIETMEISSELNDFREQSVVSKIISQL